MGQAPVADARKLASLQGTQQSLYSNADLVAAP